MRLSNTKDGSITYESMLSGNGSLLLASLAKERNLVRIYFCELQFFVTILRMAQLYAVHLPIKLVLGD